MTGSRETTMKGRDGRARDKSCDGNACHINEPMPKEVGNRVSSTSCLLVSQLETLNFSFHYSHLFSLSPSLRWSFLFSIIALFNFDYSSLYFYFPLSLLSVSSNTLQFSTSGLWPFSKGNGTKQGLFKACL